MMRFAAWILLGLFAFGGMTSCKKYEDNPNFILQSKKKRLCQEWNIVDFSVNGEWWMPSVIAWEFEFDRDGSVVESYDVYDHIYEDTEATRFGTWEWSDGKRAIDITYEDGSKQTFDIQKLTMTELSFDTFVENEEGDIEKWEFQFVSN